MSRGIKILWIVIGFLFVLGVVLTTVAFALGATGSAWYDRQGLHFGTSERIQLADRDTATFENIDIKLYEADVEIVVADNYGYEFTYVGTRDPKVEVRNGTLIVVEKNENWRINIFGWNWSDWAIFDAGAKLKVYVPRDASLNTVSLSTASGNTVFNGNQTKIKTLDCNTASGNTRLSDLDLGTLTFNVASGDVRLSNVVASHATFNMMSGDLTYSGAKLETLTLNMTSGDVDFEGEITRLLQLRALSGDSNFVLAGNKDDYSFDIRKLSGSIRVDGQRIDGNFNGPGTSSVLGSAGGGHIEIDTTSGDVNITFK
ncbi:MAG: DUF4097 domain-containing protein [Coriobacteriia bacterium]|nr:DUF4097 domain-containing protein [Coriobacteriia bacterium]MCL2749844.1 DUF4097 domain-containing protein [Coriobacteriia bacterium]